jgi:hypothetical protein
MDQRSTAGVAGCVSCEEILPFDEIGARLVCSGGLGCLRGASRPRQVDEDGRYVGVSEPRTEAAGVAVVPRVAFEKAQRRLAFRAIGIGIMPEGPIPRFRPKSAAVLRELLARPVGRKLVFAFCKALTQLSDFIAQFRTFFVHECRLLLKELEPLLENRSGLDVAERTDQAAQSRK